MQRLWLAWTDEADAEGLTDFYGLQRRAAREVFLAGEVFVRIRPRRAEDGLTVPEIAAKLQVSYDVLNQVFLQSYKMAINTVELFERQEKKRIEGE